MARIRLNSGGMKALLTDPGLAADLRSRAERVLAQAEATAPIDEGDYLDGFAIEEDTTDRAVVRVVNRDAKALVLESRLGVMSAALDAAGG